MEQIAARDRQAGRPAYDFGWLWDELLACPGRSRAVPVDFRDIVRAGRDTPVCIIGLPAPDVGESRPRFGRDSAAHAALTKTALSCPGPRCSGITCF
jgi:hypothetical protein